MKKQGLQKLQPQWLAHECPCTTGKTILHTFKCLGFQKEGIKYGEDFVIPVEYIVFQLECERCHKKSFTKLPLEEIDYLLDRLTPNVTHDLELSNQILWYWNEEVKSVRTRKQDSISHGV